MTRTDVEFRQVKGLVELGLSDYRISKLTHVPRATVQRWRKRDWPLLNPNRVPDRPWRVDDEPAYCYLLGCYLGDGHVTHKPRHSWTLCIACDRQYESVIQEVLSAMRATFPGRDPRRRRASVGASDVIAITHPGVGCAFPQHGPGRMGQRRNI
jgi:hypothetical protein